MREVTDEIMQKILNHLIEHSNYNYEDVKIIGSAFETVFENETEYLEVSSDSKIEWTEKLFYDLTEPAVYLKKITIVRDNNQ